MTLSRNMREVRLAPRGILPQPGLNQLWRVDRGLLRVSICDSTGKTSFLRMALPGDVLGIEQWAGTGRSLKFYALTDVVVNSIDVEATQVVSLLAQAVATAHLRASEALALRSGPVTTRVQRMLSMLASVQSGQDRQSSKYVIPYLADMGEILNSAPETISRNFSKLLNVKHGGGFGYYHTYRADCQGRNQPTDSCHLNSMGKQLLRAKQLLKLAN